MRSFSFTSVSVSINSSEFLGKSFPKIIMKILLLVLFVASVNAGSFKIGNVKCAFGPSYWCENYKQASECDALSHCREKVWRKSPKDACTDCQLVLNVIKEELSNPAFQKQLIGYLEQACTELGSLASECKALVDEYAPAAFQELEQLLNNTKQVCTELGLCTSAVSKEKVVASLLQKAIPAKLLVHAFKAKKVVFKPKYSSIKNSAECVLCEFIAKELDNMLGKNATEQEIIAALDKVCSILPSSIRTECTEFINEYGPAIIQILVQELNPSMICATLGLCSSKEHNKQAILKPLKLKIIGNAETCEICTLVMTYVKSLLNNNNTDEEIIAELEKLCSYLPSQLSSECKAIVGQYGKMVLQTIAKADPKVLCTEIKLCSANMKITSQKQDKSGKCYLGASFWCANKKNAIQCNSLAFCKKYAW